MTMWRTVLVSAVLIGASACTSSGATSSPTTTGAPATAAPTDAASGTIPGTIAGTTPATDAPSTTTPAPAWETITAPSDCMCSDGSTFTYFVRRANPKKVMFFFEGGGACFDATTCGPTSNSFKRTVGSEDVITGKKPGAGIFDFTNPLNPFTDWSIVYVPYCTGDVHVGNATHDYGNGVVIHHNGYVNGTTALKKLVELFPDTAELLVTGESAGSVPDPLYAGLAHDLLPQADIKVLADGSGAYPDVPLVNKVIGAAWGTTNAIPPWPENAGKTAETWSLPGLFVQAFKHDSKIVFARHDYAFDATQASFASLAGIAADNLVSLIDKNETEIEASGATLYSYISPGSSHTVLGKPGFYTETLNGTLFLDWVNALIGSKPLADVHCTECKGGA